MNNLYTMLQAYLVGAGKNGEWGLLTYRWEDDAATGGLVADTNYNFPALEHGTQAAEISHLHGFHLGQLLAYQNPTIEKVQFIAHSAGAWAARSAAKYLSLNTNIKDIQITLLDPFMPR